jgi:nitroreductase
MGDKVLDAIRKRRTIRRFTAEDISDEQVDQLLEMAMMAPNRLNRQPWHFFVIRDKGVRKKLADLLSVHPYLETASALIAVGARPELSPTWQMEVMAATENMLIAAAGLGLGAALVGNPGSVTWRRAEDLLQKALHIPVQRKVRLPILVAVGHPAEERPAHGRHDRFDLAKIHYGLWGEHEARRKHVIGLQPRAVCSAASFGSRKEACDESR